ncbi:facilitated trehalose transporter Tret1-like [Spodoptera litura]|uniref:Facilitated trehalose transporter Tret1-like n=1 Tax=Spodoptera litura TaxID=69820 RepID=A0A9J7ETB2_SPOLT|nr:facilitated trehalose transporter Tret1-like [Spodoptera litura]
MVPPFFRQAWTLSAVWTNMIGQGMMLSYTTSLLPGLQDPDSPIKADLHTASWLASSAGLSGIPGFLISSYLMDAYGRKLSHAIAILPGFIGWLCIYLARGIPALMIGRILGGMTAGATVSLGAIVIGEYSDPKYRGVFLNLKTAAVCLGGMIIHVIGHFLHWRTIALVALTPYLLSLLIIYTWPESPAWLASRGQFQKSEDSFYWLRGKSEASYNEMEELIKAQTEQRSKPVENKTCGDNVASFFDRFTQKDFLKPLFIIFIGAIVLETSGRHLFPAYALQIIGEVTGNKSQSFYYTLGIDLIITCSAVSSSILVKIMKRRTLLLSTGFAACVVMMGACVYLYLAAVGMIANDKGWIPICLFAGYFILANLGCTPIPLALLGEVFPLRHRGVGSSAAGIFISFCVMAGLQVTPYLLIHLKVYGTFAVFAGVMGLSLLVLYFILPETKDRTLQEIEDYFNYGKFKDNKVDDDAEVKIKMVK